MFAGRYAHAGMVRLGGEKMSKSLGNLVFVSKLLEAGVDPMAIRLVILAHHYRGDWDWTDEGLAAAQARLARWRAAVALAGGPESGWAGSGGAESGGPEAGWPAGESVLAGIRERIAEDLDAPGALAVVDGWAEAVLADGRADAGGSAVEPGQARLAAPGSPGALVRDAVDALLGVAL